MAVEHKNVKARVRIVQVRAKRQSKRKAKSKKAKENKHLADVRVRFDAAQTTAWRLKDRQKLLWDTAARGAWTLQIERTVAGNGMSDPE